MDFEDIIGQEEVKDFLKKIYINKRIPHALFFLGPEGSGTLPMAIVYAQKLLYNKNINISLTKIHRLQHPDLHFIFPTPIININKVKNKINKSFYKNWYEFLEKNFYGNLFDWYIHIGIKNKQGQIGVNKIQEIINKIYLKSYEGGNKVIILWMPECLNFYAANKLLKILEDPPKKTIFLFVGENRSKILVTLLSRMQIIQFKTLNLKTIIKSLQKKFEINEKYAKKIAYETEGSWNKALKILKKTEKQEFEKYFIIWIRNSFMAKKNLKALKNLVEWTEIIYSWGRERQKYFLIYCLHIFRQALLKHYCIEKLSFIPINYKNFHWKNFSNFIHRNNIKDITKNIEKGIYHIEENVNAKMVLLDLSIKIIKCLHKIE